MTTILVTGLLSDHGEARMGYASKACVYLKLATKGRPLDVRIVFGSTPDDFNRARALADKCKRGAWVEVTGDSLDFRNDHSYPAVILRGVSGMTLDGVAQQLP